MHGFIKRHKDIIEIGAREGERERETKRETETEGDRENIRSKMRNGKTQLGQSYVISLILMHACT